MIRKSTPIQQKKEYSTNRKDKIDDGLLIQGMTKNEIPPIKTYENQ